MAGGHGISTHVLDTLAGRPAQGLRVRLAKLDGGGRAEIAARETNGDGRVPDLHPGPLEAGRYEIRFEVGDYAEREGRGAGFFREITAAFEIADTGRHYHVPLILAPHSGMTYLGS